MPTVILNHSFFFLNSRSVLMSLPGQNVFVCICIYLYFVAGPRAVAQTAMQDLDHGADVWSKFLMLQLKKS